MSHYQNQVVKKGLIEKIKEKIPGVGRKKQSHTTSATGGLTEKIKEQIPGVGHQQGHTTSTTAPGHYGGQQHRQKRGVMQKIKAKLPGYH
ncbi:hypothetical protein ACB092_04G207600 [Castanea dentata]